MVEAIAKQILDKYATIVVPQNAIYYEKGEAKVNQNKCVHYEEIGYNADYVLWIPPKNWIRIEFEDTADRNHRYILELESAVKSLGFDYCITSHKGKSDYFNMVFNDLPLNDDNKVAKLLLIDMLLPSKYKEQLDRTNLGWTLSPIIGHPHWKAKYNGEVHKIIRGKNPLEHNNKYPRKLFSLIKKSKTTNKNHVKNIKYKNKWIEDFLLNYCCTNKLPAGARHFVIEKNLAAYIIFRNDKEEIKEKYYQAQERGHDSLKTWEAAILKGDYSNVSAGEIVKFIKEYSIEYDIPQIEEDLNIKGTKIDEAIDKVFSFNDFIDLSNKFYNIQPFFYDKFSMWWLWDFEDNVYKLIDEVDLMNRIDDSVNNKDTIKSTIKNEILESLKRVGRRKIPSDLPKSIIQFRDVLFDIKTKELKKATPKIFVTNPIPWAIGETDATPAMDKLFKDWVGEEYVNTLYELIAYCCIPDYPIHLIFCLSGCGRNGKSRFLALITKFLGIQNVCSTELDNLIGSRFESFKLYKKLVCQMGETNFGLLKQTSLLKKLCGQDVIGFEYKNKVPFDNYNYAKIMISSNSLPTSEDTSEGFYRRWFIIDFPNIFPEGKDILETIPNEEYNNLSNKVMKILPLLLDKGNFEKQGTVEQRMKKFIEVSNPLSLFIDQECIREHNFYVLYSVLYGAYSRYLTRNKRRVVSRKEFSKNLIQEGFEIRRTSKNINDEFVNSTFIEGVKLKEQETTPQKEEKVTMEETKMLDNKTLMSQAIEIFDGMAEKVDLVNAQQFNRLLVEKLKITEFRAEEMINHLKWRVAYFFEPKPGLLKKI